VCDTTLDGTVGPPGDQDLFLLTVDEATWVLSISVQTLNAVGGTPIAGDTSTVFDLVFPASTGSPDAVGKTSVTLGAIAPASAHLNANSNYVGADDPYTVRVYRTGTTSGGAYRLSVTCYP